MVLAEDHDDHTDGISALGIAFTDAMGDLHAVSIPFPPALRDAQGERHRSPPAASRGSARVLGS